MFREPAGKEAESIAIAIHDFNAVFRFQEQFGLLGRNHEFNHRNRLPYDSLSF